MRLLVLFISTLALAGCKQGLGERCQIDTDCKAPLICVSATNTCQTGTGGTLDANIPEDAPADSAPLDTPADMATD